MKFLLDECIGRPVAHQLIALLSFSSKNFEILYIPDFVGAGTADRDWIGMAQKGDAVITADLGNRREPLPLLLPPRGITGFFLSRKLHHAKQFLKVQALTDLWPQIVDQTHNVVPGTRFKIVCPNDRFRLQLWPLKPKHN